MTSTKKSKAPLSVVELNRIANWLSPSRRYDPKYPCSRELIAAANKLRKLAVWLADYQ